MSCANGPYSVTPLPLVGAEVRGIDLKQNTPTSVVERIKQDVYLHRLLVFKYQGVISGERQVEISKWFGDLESTFYKHPRSPHLDVFRVSNDASEGCTNVGRTGWHIDGSFMHEPFSHSIYHMVNVPKSGNTGFTPLNELVQQLNPERRARWNRLWMVSDRRDLVVHPLMYHHPHTGKETLCFHLGMTQAFIWDSGSIVERLTDWPETKEILAEIDSEVIRDNGKYTYSHKWEEGDFIISDNLAVGHEASPETQYPVEDVGLRVLHRTTIKGTSKPQKRLLES